MVFSSEKHFFWLVKLLLTDHNVDFFAGVNLFENNLQPNSLSKT